MNNTNAVKSILEKSEGTMLTKEDAIILLNINNESNDFYNLLAKASLISRSQYKNRGYIFAQIGINCDPCSGNCKFCSLAKDNFMVDSKGEKTVDEILSEIQALDLSKLAALFLMTTADYDYEKYLEVGRTVRKIIPKDMDFIANIGDFDYQYALRLKEAGFTGVYHIVRLREGIDTDIDKDVRIATLDALTKAGLKLYYCVEPIGKEHSYEEIADEMMRAKNYNVDVMAVMRRVSVEGTRYGKKDEITQLELTKIAAVARLVVNPKISMNVHEPMMMPILAGVNQLYAETGINPRDNKHDTENGRGFTIENVEKMLNEGQYYL